MNRRDFLNLSAAGLASGLSDRTHGPSFEAMPDFSHLDARLRERVELGYCDGMGLMLGRGEHPLHQAWFGDAGPDVVRHVASMGKWTAAAIAALVDEGKLRWDDPVRKFLPRFAEGKGDATLRQLLSHSAGYPDYQPEGRRRDDYQTLEEAVGHIVDLPAAGAPGAAFQYGGLAMQWPAAWRRWRRACPSTPSSSRASPGRWAWREAATPRYRRNRASAPCWAAVCSPAPAITRAS
ncbi:Beta-lactamase [Pseudoduganella namucuonensis]|uniref:Beta-lactamase n=1 Tax=Pseudoduganella namucuonensis TaxID=1035707 RepID=A0A1I7H717_9BURK|nr:Beta-lactamase [Pseudoduganella namucuonensis]